MVNTTYYMNEQTYYVPDLFQKSLFYDGSRYAFKIFIYLFIFREGKAGRKRGRETPICERNIYQLPLACFQLGTWPANPGMCPDWELNQWHFGSQVHVQTTGPHQPGPGMHFLTCFKLRISGILLFQVIITWISISWISGRYWAFLSQYDSSFFMPPFSVHIYHVL